MTTIPDHAPREDPAANGTPRGYTDHRDGHLSRLHKVQGQVRGITRTVDTDRYRIDILTQISAVTHALQEIALGLLDDHIRHCIHDAVRAGEAEGETTLDELTPAPRRTLRL